MVRIFTNVIKVLKRRLVRVVQTTGVISRTIMLSTSSDALPAVVGASQFCEIGIRINSSKENGFILRVMLASKESNRRSEHEPDSCQRWQRVALGPHREWWGTRERKCGRWIGSSQKRLDESGLRRDSVKTWCSDIFGTIWGRFV